MWTVICVVATIYLVDWVPTRSYPPASKYKSINLWPPCVLVGCSPPAELGNVAQPCWVFEPFSVANNQLLVLDELRCGLRMVRVKWKHVNSVYLDPCAYIQDLLHLYMCVIGCFWDNGVVHVRARPSQCNPMWQFSLRALEV